MRPLFLDQTDGISHLPNPHGTWLCDLLTCITPPCQPQVKVASATVAYLSVKLRPPGPSRTHQGQRARGLPGEIKREARKTQSVCVVWAETMQRASDEMTLCTVSHGNQKIL